MLQRSAQVIFIYIACVGQIMLSSHTISLPFISLEFNILESQAQYVTILYLAGYGISQIPGGVLSDFYGRKIVFASGFLLCSCASFLAFSSSSFWVLCLARFIQGLCMGPIGATIKAYIRDICSGLPYAKIISNILIFTLTSTAVAPGLGGLLLSCFKSWQPIFLMHCILCLGGLMAVSKLQKTDSTLRLSPSSFNTYLHILKNQKFLIYAFISSFVFAGDVCYEVMCPFIFKNEFNLSIAESSLGYTFSIVGMILGTIFVQKKNCSLNSFISIGIFLCLLAATIISFPKSIFYFLIVTSVYMFGCGVIYGTASAVALEESHNNAGLAAGLLGTIHMIIPTLITFLSGHWGPGLIYLSLAMILLNIVCLFLHVFFMATIYIKKRSNVVD
jgi:DHA1 family bicyclomycin/chloramphenicol resistance-like MFS transporter